MPDPITGTETEDWGNIFNTRNLDLLKLLLACPTVAKIKGETDISRQMMSTATKKLNAKINRPEFDAKDVAIATLLVSYISSISNHC